MNSVCDRRLVLLAIAIALPRFGFPSDNSDNWKQMLEPVPLADSDANIWKRWSAAAGEIDLSWEDEDLLLTLTDPDNPVPTPETLRRAGTILDPLQGLLDDLICHPGEYLAPPTVDFGNPGMHVGRLQTLTRLNALRTVVLWFGGHKGKAVRFACGLCRTGRSILFNADGLLNFLTGIAATETALGRIYWMVNEEQVSQEWLVEFQQTLIEEHEAFLTGLCNSLLYEAFRDLPRAAPEIESITDKIDGGEWSREVYGFLELIFTRTHLPLLEESSQLVEFELFDREETERSFQNVTMLYVTSLKREEGWPQSHFQREFEMQYGQWANYAERFTREIANADSIESVDQRAVALKAANQKFPNPVGRQWIANMVSTPGRFATTSLLAYTRSRALALLIEMRKYQLRGEALPSTIEELAASSELKVSITDPFSGEPLRYDPKRLAIWSVGTNGVDDGGVAGERPQDGSDFVWTLKPASHDATFSSPSPR